MTNVTEQNKKRFINPHSQVKYKILFICQVCIFESANRKNKMQRNFYNTLKPLIIFLSCMGLVPYCFKNNKLHTPRFHSIHIAFLITMYFIVSYDAINAKYQAFQKTPLSSHMIIVAVSITQIMMILINTMTRKKKFARFSQTMLRCENDFREIMHIPHKEINRETYAYAAIFFVVVATTVGMQLRFLGGAYDNKLSIYSTIFALPIVANGSICLLALPHVLKIRQGFCVVNECLTRMQITKRQELFVYEKFLKQKLWKPTIENLSMIGKLHLDLSNCIREFNDIFGVLLVAKFIMSFVKILMGVYFAFFSFQLALHVRALSTLMTALLYTASLTVLCQKCSSTIKEVNACSINLFAFIIYKL